MHTTLINLLQSRATRTPTQHAYTYLRDGEADELSWNYGELDRRARAIAAWLQSLGAAGARALLLYPPGLDYIAAFFGCLYAGVVAVPVYPPQRQRGLPRVQAIQSDSCAQFVLSTTSIGAKIQSTPGQAGDHEELAALRWLNTDRIEPGMEGNWAQPSLDADALAFIQYTSGSTGTPKGVKVSHGNLLHNQRAIQEAFGHRSDEVIVGWLPLYHDMGLIGNVLQPLYIGAPCILMSPVHFLQKPVRWLSAVSRYRATTSGGPNFSYDLCARQVTEAQRADLDLRSWTVAFNGAEPVRAATMERFYKRFRECGFRRQAFYPCYGLAEATLLVSGGTKEAGPIVRSKEDISGSQAAPFSSDAQDNRIVGCGRAQGGQSIRIVHPDSAVPCAEGQEGEIWVGGPSVAQGYWKRDAESKDTFQATLSPSGEGPFLRTGDLGRLRDGELFVTGRLKDLIIIRGRNHYPQDIERTVEESHPSLRAGGCAAFSVTQGEEEQLVVVQEVSPRARLLDVPAIADTVRQAVAQSHELSVAAVVLIKAGDLPKTSSGKVQRGLCRTQFLSRSLATVGESTRTIASPQPALAGEHPAAGEGDHDGLGAAIAEIWSEVLNRPTVGAQDDFFALGGDSLRGLQMVARLQEVRGIEVAPETLFEHSTLATFTALVASAAHARVDISHEPIPTIERKGMLPLSLSQERFWFFEQLSSGSSINNIPVALRLRGPLDGEALRSALNEIVRRHEIIRASFVLVDGRPSHVISPQLSVALAIEKSDSGTKAQREEDILRAVRTEACRPFDLNGGPLIRCRLFQLSETEHWLSVTLHHIIADGQSMEIIRRELFTLYVEFREKQSSSLSALPLQYVDVAAWQRREVGGEAEHEQLEYWRSRLDGVPPLLTLPWDFPRPAIQGARGARFPWKISSAMAERLQAVGSRYRVTPFMLLLSAFGIFLSRYSSQTDFCIGTPVANRQRHETENLVGCFVNTVALRLEFSGDSPFPELLNQVRQTVLGAQAHQALPFERLVDELGVARDLGHTPLFQVMFVLEGMPLEAQLADLEVSRVPVSTGTSVFDLTLEMARNSDGSLDAVFEYSTDLFAESTIARMAGQLQELLRQLVAMPEARPSEWGMLSVAEQAAVLADGIGPRKPALQKTCLHRLLEAQARRTPQALALETLQGAVTYDELNRKANQLARYLRRQGIAPDTTVGLWVDRSLEMAVGLLGCLKAGAVYVPMDPAYPMDRKAAIIRDAQPVLILTQAKYREALPPQAPTTFLLDVQWNDAASQSDQDLSTGPHPDQLAYLLYTSGTTGQPKGIGISHRALTHHGLAMREAYDLSPTDRVLQFASISFDVVAEECFPTWLAGGTVVLRSQEPVPAYVDFNSFLRAREVTVVNLPTPYWAGWIEEMERISVALPSALRLTIVGSEKAQMDDLRRWKRMTDTCAWCNAYGPTETTVTASTYGPATDSISSTWRTVPIGRPIANVELYVLDAHLQPLPIGVPGELYIGGAGLARGYHRLAAMTAERFLPHPFSPEGGARLYRTGDLARRRADGELDFLGRGDDQVKIRGFRVELQDIESHVRLHPQVKDVRVWLESDGGSDWEMRLAGLNEPDRDQLIGDIERLSMAEAQWLCALESDIEQRRKTVIQRKPEFEVFLKINKDEFLTPPRANQRNWLLRRALDEFSDDLLALDDVSKRFVSGSDRADIARTWTDSHAEYRPSELIIEGQQVMQDWEAPLMKAMADLVTEQQGDVLEVGFGMGISASYIQAGQPKSHTIIECNREVMQAFGAWADRYRGRDIRLVQGRWQDVLDDLGTFDGVFFDTYPASEAEFEESVLNSINFAEGFIPVAAKLLRPGGVFTYYSNEIDSFSRRHQRFLLSHFGSFTLSVVRSLLPPDDCHYWWADSMVLVKAVK